GSHSSTGRVPRPPITNSLPPTCTKPFSWRAVGPEPSEIDAHGGTSPGGGAVVVVVGGKVVLEVVVSPGRVVVVSPGCVVLGAVTVLVVPVVTMLATRERKEAISSRRTGLSGQYSVLAGGLQPRVMPIRAMALIWPSKMLPS